MSNKKDRETTKGRYKFPVQADGTKECRDCHRFLPLSQYSKGTSAGGKHINCKDCQNEYYSTYQSRQRKINRQYEARGEYRVKEKACDWCGGTFEAAAFNRDVTRPDGLQCFCKLCSSIWGRYYYYRPKPQKVKMEDVLAYRHRVDQFKD